MAGGRVGVMRPLAVSSCRWRSRTVDGTASLSALFSRSLVGAVVGGFASVEVALMFLRW